MTENRKRFLQNLQIAIELAEGLHKMLIEWGNIMEAHKETKDEVH